VSYHLKLLYTSITLSKRHLNFVETVSIKTTSSFFRRLEEEDKLVKVSSDSSALKIETLGLCHLMNGYIVGWNFRCNHFLKDLKKSTVTSIQQAEKDVIMLVVTFIKEDMWFEEHDLVSLLPLNPVTKLDY
jgi:hypothetical protein